MKINSYFPPLVSLDRPNPSARDPSNSRCAQGNDLDAVDSPANSTTSTVFPKQKSAQDAWSRSKNIPVPRSRLTKQAAAAEITQAEEELLADVRDCAMFTRIVQGMTKKASFIQDLKCREDIDLCLAHIVATRYLTKEELSERGISNKDLAHPYIVAGSNTRKDGSPLPNQCTCALGRLCKDDVHALICHTDDDQSLEEMIFDMDL